MSRQQTRRELRKMGEFITRAVLGKIGRPNRGQVRLAGRVYGNAAYRRINKLDHELYGGAEHGYTEHQAHADILKWMTAEWEKLNEQHAPTEAREVESVGTDSLGTDASHP